MNNKFQIELENIVNAYNTYWGQVGCEVTIDYICPNGGRVMPIENGVTPVPLYLWMNIPGSGKYSFLKEVHAIAVPTAAEEIKEILAEKAIFTLARHGINSCWQDYAMRKRRQFEKERARIKPASLYPLKVTDISEYEKDEQTKI